MDGKSLLRHFFLFLLLLFVLGFLNKESFVWWVRSRMLFLLPWLGIVAAGGFLGDFLARRHQRIPAPENEGFLHRLYRQWISCSRCAGFWISGVLSSGLAIFTFPAPQPLITFLIALYFFLLGASLGAAIAIGLYLYRR
ncbi:MAG: hypothetical protein HS115_17515 [Spirochaetales bacterium]|nr:hypothetical protein [Spirochaetales bacterium]